MTTMPNRLPHLGLLLTTLVLCTACGSAHTAYRPDPLSLAPLETPPQDDKRMYLDLIGQMQRQGAYFASLAHVDAYRQRYGDSPALRLLQADGLRETQQVDAARSLYTSLANGPQGAAAWHGLGLIAARAGDAAQAETSLARAVQLQPLNTDYLGDLGFARLRAGHLAQAREPLAKAAELAPGNVKANANLAVWALLRNDTAMADQIMRSAALPAAARDEVQRLAQQLRQPPAAVPPATAPAPVSEPARPGAPVAATAARPPRADARLAPSMLERFGGADPAHESTP
ncbi:Flp pilus assembly protein TadD [Stenotrophomonas sp. BIGb0135]|jgi:Flp pilus assembly protein TadD|uniref:tetratricopeptide repeat protein n=1 Tax=Stenotrophomonas sp. BIGb0135 TaxID=2940620 RepID=UPI0021688339|nr:Flp pilus assembly protein TadD [Stenotrophomonas sp. BIGb0135]